MNTYKPLVFIALIASIALVACTIPAGLAGQTKDPSICSKAEVQQYTDAVKSATQRFDDSLQLANNTARIALAPIVRDMQAIRRETEAITVPVCATKAKGALINYMDAAINAFIAFMAQKPNSEIQSLMNLVSASKTVYESTVLALNYVAPTPTP